MAVAPRTARLIFGREPAAWISATSAALALLVAFGLPLSTEQTGAVIAALVACASAFTAWAVQPVAPAIFEGAAKAVLALGVSFGLGWSAEQQGLAMTFVSVVLTMLLRPQVSPPVPAGGVAERQAPVMTFASAGDTADAPAPHAADRG